MTSSGSSGDSSLKNRVVSALTAAKPAHAPSPRTFVNAPNEPATVSEKPDALVLLAVDVRTPPDEVVLDERLRH